MLLPPFCRQPTQAPGRSARCPSSSANSLSTKPVCMGTGRFSNSSHSTTQVPGCRNLQLRPFLQPAHMPGFIVSPLPSDRQEQGNSLPWKQYPCRKGNVRDDMSRKWLPARRIGRLDRSVRDRAANTSWLQNTKTLHTHGRGITLNLWPDHDLPCCSDIEL